LNVDWEEGKGWTNPSILPFGDFQLSPAASCLHYALECFEGMKAYKDKEGNIRLFRPLRNMARMNDSMSRLYMPSFDGEEYVKCLEALLKVEERWIPEGEGFSIYLRPTAISTYPFLGVGATKQIKLFTILSPVGPYYPDGFKPISLYASNRYVRAWPGGAGNSKLGGNYAPTIKPQMEAMDKYGCSQVMWLFGEDHDITEVGAMNLFFVIETDETVENKEGQMTKKREVWTAPLTRGDILPGVTRASIIETIQEWQDPSVEVKEKFMNINKLIAFSKEGKIKEVFGAGTAVVVSPVKSILYNQSEGEEDEEGSLIQVDIPTGEGVGEITEKMWDTITGIQYGEIDSEWSHVIS
jgi:branched-chain amino acid aminotransferase